MFGHRTLTPRAFFRCVFTLEASAVRREGMNKNWVSGVPEFLVYIHQNVSWYIGIMCFDISLCFTV